MAKLRDSTKYRRLARRTSSFFQPALGLLLFGLALGACGARTRLGVDGDAGSSVVSGGAGGTGGGVGGVGRTGGAGAVAAGGIPSFPGTGGTGGLVGGGGRPGGAGGIPPLASGGMPPDPPLTDPRLDCPVSLADPRLPDLQVGVFSEIDGAMFVTEPPSRYFWSVVNRDCDAIVEVPTYELLDTSSPEVLFKPGRPTGYTLELTAEWDAGAQAESCQFDLQVPGRGVRIELCWDTSGSVDLDLYVHTPENTAPFMDPGLISAYAAAESGYDACNPLNCPATIRSERRVDFGYPDSPLEFCEAGPSAAEFLALGYCPNPRAGLDNNQSLSSGTTETVQIDNPQPGDVLRVMAHNFSNLPASPSVFVYCGGRRAGAFPPPTPAGEFRSDDPGGFGVMWRPADVRIIDSINGLTRCSAEELVDPTTGEPPYVTVDDPSY